MVKHFVKIHIKIAISSKLLITDLQYKDTKIQWITKIYK
jgi:hypothetical protein